MVPGVDLDEVGKLKSEAAGAIRSLERRTGEALKSLEKRASQPR